MPQFFRIDEFAQVADGVLTARDRVRFTGVGFDIGLGPGAPTVVGLIFVSGEQATIPTAVAETAFTGSGG